ncbi:hypothetical protein [Clostridium sp. AM58-1XD]|uniref:hypothetical protein n=1 Tax=Clostridium sp. AM58-1XD TaxID=2292307 RepID=UPI0026AFA8CD
MARGFMVSWMAEHEIEDAERLKDFCECGYRYAPEYSGEREFVFLKGGRNESTKET